MKIVFFSHSSNLYGAPKSLLLIIESLAKKYDIQVITRGEGDLTRQLRSLGVPIYVIPNITYQSKYVTSLSFRVINKLYAFCHDVIIFLNLLVKRPNLIYVNTITNSRPVLFAHLLGIVCLVHVHEGKQYFSPLNPGTKRSIELILKYCSNYICVSSGVEELLLKKLGSSLATVRQIHNGISFQPSDIPSCKLQLPAGCASKKVIGFIGSLTHRKGLDIFLQSAVSLLAVRDDIIFLVVGGTELEFKEFVASCSFSNGLPSQIIHQPFLQKPALAYKTFDIFCMTSREEPFGLVNLEAACMKVPVIATDVDGSRDIFRHGETAIIVPPGDHLSLMNAIMLLLDNQRLCNKIAAAAYDHVSRNFSRRKFIAEVSEYVESLMIS